MHHSLCTQRQFDDHITDCRARPTSLYSTAWLHYQLTLNFTKDFVVSEEYGQYWGRTKAGLSLPGCVKAALYMQCVWPNSCPSRNELRLFWEISNLCVEQRHRRQVLVQVICWYWNVLYVHCYHHLAFQGADASNRAVLTLPHLHGSDCGDLTISLLRRHQKHVYNTNCNMHLSEGQVSKSRKI